MLADSFPFRLAFWLGRTPRLDVIPAAPAPEALPPSGTARPVLRPADEMETRLILRDRGWRPDV